MDQSPRPCEPGFLSPSTYMLDKAQKMKLYCEEERSPAPPPRPNMPFLRPGEPTPDRLPKERMRRKIEDTIATSDHFQICAGEYLRMRCKAFRAPPSMPPDLPEAFLKGFGEFGGGNGDEGEMELDDERAYPEELEAIHEEPAYSQDFKRMDEDEGTQVGIMEMLQQDHNCSQPNAGMSSHFRPDANWDTLAPRGTDLPRSSSSTLVASEYSHLGYAPNQQNTEHQNVDVAGFAPLQQDTRGGWPGQPNTSTWALRPQQASPNPSSRSYPQSKHIPNTPINEWDGSVCLLPFHPKGFQGRPGKNRWQERAANVLRRPSQLFNVGKKYSSNVHTDNNGNGNSAPLPQSSSSFLSVPGKEKVAKPLKSPVSFKKYTDPFFASLFKAPPQQATPDIMGITSTSAPNLETSHVSISSSRSTANSYLAPPSSTSYAQLPSHPTSSLRSTSNPLPTRDRIQVHYENDPLHRPKRRRLPDVPTGLPIMPFNACWFWQTPFPGNTYNLAQILLTWHTTLTALYKQIQTTSPHYTPQLISLNPAFPFPPSAPPTHIPLVAASFWDTQGGKNDEKDKEVWRIGPGDVAKLSLNGVDVFAGDNEDRDVVQSSFVDAAGFGDRRVGGVFSLKKKRKYAVDARARMQTGEGRWCFLVIQGRPFVQRQQQQCRHEAGRERPKQRQYWHTGGKRCQDNGPGPFADEAPTAPPYIVVAFPQAAVTSTSECLHILYPDEEFETPMGFEGDERRTVSTPARPIPTVTMTPPTPTPKFSNTAPAPRETGRYVSKTSVMAAAAAAPSPYVPMLQRHTHSMLNQMFHPRSSSSSNLRNVAPSLGDPFDANGFANITPDSTPPRQSQKFNSSASNGNYSFTSSAPSENHSLNGNRKESRGWPVRRTILTFNSAGYVPLVEGYGVDLGNRGLRGWMEAVGRGEGKLVVFGEV